jgi:hypothetical protein
MFVSAAAADEPPRKRNKTTASDTDAIEKVGFLFILLFDTHQPEQKFCTPQPALDFFGRPITMPMANSNKPASSRKQTMPVYRVSFRFKEGNSAAVRKSVKMASFL